ncbi:hypothetical protein CROQUDRAFT_28996, partial [Cronartium quercuum f. sp. fusiforme G11]
TSSQSGEGTMWGGNWNGGNCLFSQWPQPADLPEIAMGGDNWKDGLYCGACIEVQSGSNKPVIGIVGDKCPSCKPNSLDLDPKMWNRVTGGANPGIIKITWKLVACNFSGLALLLTKKDGSNPHFFAVQVSQTNSAIISLEYRPSGSSSWEKAKRDTNSNFCDQGGKPAGKTADIKVLCADGVTEVITNAVDLSGPGVVKGPSNC